MVVVVVLVVLLMLLRLVLRLDLVVLDAHEASTIACWVASTCCSSAIRVGAAGSGASAMPAAPPWSLPAAGGMPAGEVGPVFRRAHHPDRRLQHPGD